MAGRAKTGLAGLLLGAVVATAGVSLAAGEGTSRLADSKVSFNYSKVDFGVFDGAPRGIVAAAQRFDRPAVRAHISLHELAPMDSTSNTYLVVANRRTCSNIVNADDFVVWRSSIIMANTEGDFHLKSASLRSGLRTAKSVRIYEVIEGQDPVQRACAALNRGGD